MGAHVKAKTAADMGFSAYKVRIVIGTALIHVLSRTVPVVRLDGVGSGIASVSMEVIEGTEHGDSIGWIQWSDVRAVTWRKA